MIFLNNNRERFDFNTFAFGHINQIEIFATPLVILIVYDKAGRSDTFLHLILDQ